MSTIKVTRHHQLDHQHALQAADELAQSLSRDFDVQYQWKNEVLYFNRRGANGELHVGPQTIQIELKLGLLLSAFRDRIEREIHHHLDNLLEQGRQA